MPDFDFLQDSAGSRSAKQLGLKYKRKKSYTALYVVAGAAVLLAAGAVGFIVFQNMESTVSGELFFKTKGGDTKKAGGETVYLMPITPEARKKITAWLVEWHEKKKEWDAARAEQFLRQDSRSAVANADGQFALSAPTGQYLLWTTTHSIMEDKFFWLNVLTISGSTRLELGSDAVVDSPEKMQSLLICMRLADQCGWVQFKTSEAK